MGILKEMQKKELIKKNLIAIMFSKNLCNPTIRKNYQNKTQIIRSPHNLRKAVLHYV